MLTAVVRATCQKPLVELTTSTTPSTLSIAPSLGWEEKGELEAPAVQVEQVVEAEAVELLCREILALKRSRNITGN
jgi:hypothetical protein